MQMLKDRLIFVSLVLAVILNIILWLLLAGKFGFSSYRIPLHFNVVYGIDFLGSSRQIYEIPLAGLAVGLVNSFLAMQIYGREKLLAYFLTFSSLAVQIFLLAGAASLIVLNA